MWKRMVLAVIAVIQSSLQEMVVEYLTRRAVTNDPEANDKIRTRTSAKAKPKPIMRRGIGSPLSRSKASKWDSLPTQCEHPSNHLVQRGTAHFYWWTCTKCGARWKRVEWEGDHEANLAQTGATSSRVPKSSVAYPKQLPPPKSRPELKNLIVKATEVIEEDADLKGDLKSIKDIKNRVEAAASQGTIKDIKTEQPRARKERPLAGLRQERRPSRPRSQKPEAECYEIAKSDKDLDYDMVAKEVPVPVDESD